MCLYLIILFLDQTLDMALNVGDHLLNEMSVVAADVHDQIVHDSVAQIPLLESVQVRQQDVKRVDCVVIVCERNRGVQILKQF